MKLLVEQRLDELETVTGGKGLSAQEISTAVDDVGNALVMPPESVWRDLDVIAIKNRPSAFNVLVDLWIARGHADWSVELTLHSMEGRPVIELDDTHRR